MKLLGWVVVVIVGMLAALIFVKILPRFWPSALIVRLAPALSWTGAVVEARENPARPQRFAPGGGEIRVSPIQHGYYTVGVTLADGRQVWSDFLHLDAGDRRRVDLLLTPSTRSGCVHLRLTCSVWLLPRREVLFDGEVRPADTSEQEPVHLAGP